MSAPAYTLRVSNRARRARLQVSPGEGLVVVVPRGFDQAELPAMLDAHRDWIDRQLARLPEPAEIVRPDELHLPAADRRWRLEWFPAHEHIGYQPVGRDCLHLVADEDDWAEPLRMFLRNAAKGHLAPRLRELAAAHGFTPNKITIRLQKTRWGSCSAAGNINLNARLMLLEPALVDHILVHELCHLRHHNHSKAFWAEVAAIEPDWRANRQALQSAGRQLPGWAQ